MSNETVLLRVMVGPSEGWKWMYFEEFPRQLDLAAWRDDEMLAGMVLPPPEDPRALDALSRSPPALQFRGP